jgi:DNA-binding MarR family transcriptional regulator
MELIDQGHRGISRHLDLTRVRILGLVAAKGPIRPSAVAAELGLTASATSRHLSALEQAAQVAVEADPTDSRTFLVRPTEDGRREVDVTIQAGADVFAEVVEDWTDEEVATARALITRLNQAWSRRGESKERTAQEGTGPRWRRARRQRADQEGEKS